jgi:hypothetical protein
MSFLAREEHRTADTGHRAAGRVRIKRLNAGVPKEIR